MVRDFSSVNSRCSVIEANKYYRIAGIFIGANFCMSDQKSHRKHLYFLISCDRAARRHPSTSLPVGYVQYCLMIFHLLLIQPFFTSISTEGLTDTNRSLSRPLKDLEKHWYFMPEWQVACRVSCRSRFTHLFCCGHIWNAWNFASHEISCYTINWKEKSAAVWEESEGGANTIYMYLLPSFSWVSWLPPVTDQTLSRWWYWNSCTLGSAMIKEKKDISITYIMI